MLAKQLAWAADTDAAKNEAFNIVNGDVFRWSWLWPKLAEWDSSLLVAVDHAYVKRDAALHDGAEVAIMPPVQGG